MEKVKLEDIAQACGVSTATVLRVVRNNGYVSEEKRKRIEEAIARMGYVAKQTSRNAILPKAKIIAHFLHGNSHPLFGRLSDGIGKIAMENGYFIITQHVDKSFDAARIAKTIEQLRAYHISGVILNSLADIIDFIPIARYLQTLPIPVVMMERVADIYHINKVLINAQEGMFLAVQNLIKQGHKQILLINESPASAVERGRVDGFFSAAEGFGIRESVSFTATQNYTFDEGYRAISQYAQSHSLPTAIIACDSLLGGVMRFFYERDIHVPRDVSLVGLDDTFADVFTPKLTSVAFPEKEMCETAISLILEQSGKREESSAKQILLSPHLVERQSVAPPCRA